MKNDRENWILMDKLCSEIDNFRQYNPSEAYSFIPNITRSELLRVGFEVRAHNKGSKFSHGYLIIPLFSSANIEDIIKQYPQILYYILWLDWDKDMETYNHRMILKSSGNSTITNDPYNSTEDSIIIPYQVMKKGTIVFESLHE